jgi:OmcA/MtrC family decaheme c-type cytochrome
MTKCSITRLSAICFAALLAACSGSSGSDGAPGAKGDTGDQGPQGVAGPVTMTNESCMVCHASTRLVPTATSHALSFATGTQDSLVLSNVTVADSGGHPAISFHVANSAGPVTNIANGDLRVFVAGQIPGAASDYFARWVQERSGTFDNGSGTQNYPFGTLANLTGGDYTYTLAALTANAPAASTYQRIFLRVSKTGMNTANAIYDFDKAAVATPVANVRDIVPTAACNSCHVARIADHGHGGGYNVEGSCVVCHSPLLDESPFSATPHDMQALGYDFPTMIHQIHSATNHTALKGNGSDWSKVTYPNVMKNCATCHTGGTASDNWKNKPSRMACGSCHTGVDFATGANHLGGPRDNDTSCVACHDAANITAKHSTAPTGKNIPEYDATLSITPPANGTHYVAGEAPVVTVTLKNHADGTDVAAALYTTAKDSAGVAGGGLAVSRLYVYGPRTAPKPVLTAAAAATPMAQANNLFVPSTDTNVKTDSAGFKYQLAAIPAGMTPGTYMVRFYAGDYGYKSDTDYVTSSNAFTTIQIGTATAQKKVSGDCTKCHGTAPAPFHDARHGVVFDTDECISCHDLSGGHAAPLSNRVHAVHSGSVTGDIMNISWAETEYPVGTKNGGAQNCAVCHDSTSTQFQQNVSEVSCRGCHADNVGATDHMLQNGGKY